MMYYFDSDPGNLLILSSTHHYILQAAQPSVTATGTLNLYSFLMGACRQEGKRNKYPVIAGLLPAAHKSAAEATVKERCYREWQRSSHIDHFCQVDEENFSGR